MVLIEKNFRKLVSTLQHTVMIDDYLLRHVFPKIKGRNMDYDRIKNRTSYLTQLAINCPFHMENDPSFRIFFLRNDYFCFGACRRGGGPIELHQHARESFDGVKLNKIKAVIELADLYHIQYDPLYAKDDYVSDAIYGKPITPKDFEAYTKIDFSGIEQTEHWGTYYNELEAKVKRLRQDNNVAWIDLEIEIHYLQSLGLTPSDKLLKYKELYQKEFNLV